MGDLSALRAIEGGALTDDEAMALAALLSALRDPRPLNGLSPAEVRVVRAIQAAGGSPVCAERLAVIASPQAGPEQVRVLIYRVRRKRPDIGACVRSVWGRGYVWMQNQPH